MKPLNRPMFRYGGPIKEGIMSGIKEPRQGYNVAGRVFGSVKNFFKPKAPVTGGITATNKGGFIPAMGTKIKELFTGKKVTTGPGTVTIPAQPGRTIYSGAHSMRVPPSAAKTVEKMGPSQVTTELAPFAPGGPTNQNIYALLQRGIVPTVGAAGKVLSAAKPYTGTIVIGGTLYSVLKPDGTPKSVDELSAESGADGNTIVEKVKEKITTSGAGDGIELSDKEKRAKQIEKYRDIMDIKGMNKAAAYDSLIAASQAVNQAGGDLKGAIKDGSLINQIIQSTSKAFDKPAKTKDAIDTLILKGEIEKDIKASDPTTKLDAEYKRAKIAESKEKLNPSFNTLKAGYGKDNKGQSGIDLAAAEYSDNQGQTFRGNIISKSDFNEIKEDIKEKSGAVDEITIITNWTNATIKGKNVPDGNYTVGDKIVTIQDNVVIDVE
jgi:hypothetical protein